MGQVRCEGTIKRLFGVLRAGQEESVHKGVPLWEPLRQSQVHELLHQHQCSGGRQATLPWRVPSLDSVAPEACAFTMRLFSGLWGGRQAEPEKGSRATNDVIAHMAKWQGGNRRPQNESVSVFAGGGCCVIPVTLFIVRQGDRSKRKSGCLFSDVCC